MKPKFVSSTDRSEKLTIHTTRDNVEFRIGSDTDEIFKNFLILV